MRQHPIIADRAEFVDALDRLLRGHVLVRPGDGSSGCVLDGGIVYTAHRTLIDYGLVDEFDNPAGFAGVGYYRLNPRGRAFALRVCEHWRHRPLLERIAMRLTG